MATKPYSPSHIGAVASNFTTLRISGDVKSTLSELLCEELDTLVPQMERETLEIDPDRKTLDDPQRTRLNYSRTRGLMQDRLDMVDSIGSAAVQAGVEHLEEFLSDLLNRAEMAADKDRVGTIKPRHLEAALAHMGRADEDASTSNKLIAAVAEALPAQNASSPVVVGQSAGVLTEATLVSLARSHAGMPVTADAAREMLDMYYMVVDNLQEQIIQSGLMGSNPAQLLDSINKMKDLMGLGWMRRKLKASADNARERGYKRIDIDQIVNIDPFE